MSGEPRSEHGDRNGGVVTPTRIRQRPANTGSSKRRAPSAPRRAVRSCHPLRHPPLEIRAAVQRRRANGRFSPGCLNMKRGRRLFGSRRRRIRARRQSFAPLRSRGSEGSQQSSTAARVSPIAHPSERIEGKLQVFARARDVTTRMFDLSEKHSRHRAFP